MYEKFYQLKEKTFNLNPDPEYFYMSREHENAFTHLDYFIKEKKGFAVITGEVGSGKTTLINYTLTKIPLDVQVGLINNTNIAPSQLLRMICTEFELDVDGLEKTDLMDSLQDYLTQQYHEGNQVVLFIDEAQNLPAKTVEEIRMLSNLEAEKKHLIHMVLIGQPELKKMLTRPELRQFAQRVTVNCHISGLSPDEVNDYIKYRLKVGESKNMNLFTENAVDKIFEYTGGIPRLINVLCDTALVYGYGEGLSIVDSEIIEEVIKDRNETGIFKKISAVESIGLNDQSENNSVDVSRRSDEKDAKDILGKLEQRIELMERMLINLEEKVTRVSKLRDTRDETLIELLKIVAEGLKSRSQRNTKENQKHQQRQYKEDITPPQKKPISMINK